MTQQLMGLWLRRFVLVLPIVGVALIALQFVRHLADADYAGAWLWSTVAAALSASLNTWWAYRRGCGLRR
ncbi:MAG: hypothetical protein ACREPE_15810 [Lysobacter sp.]